MPRTDSAAGVDRERWPYRMKDLCEQTGLDRQTIHFYITKGLLPEGHKTGRNMAYYGSEHLDRIRLIRELKTERFLPLDTIKAVLDGEDHEFTPEQKALLVEVKDRVADVLGADQDGPAKRPKTVASGPLLRKHGLLADELTRMQGIGLLTTVEVRGRTHVYGEDVWLIELWSGLRAAGFTRERGYEVEDLAMYVEAITGLFRAEVRRLMPRMATLSPDEVAGLLRRGLPLINSLISRFHTAKARDFFDSLDG